jgi:hypothetical protein
METTQKNSFGRVQVNDLNQALITTCLDVVIGVMPQVIISIISANDRVKQSQTR